VTPFGDHTLRAAYERHVRERGFRKDKAQLAAVEALEDLRARLIAANGTQSESKAKRLSKRALSKLGLASEHAERGLYLWGGVGRGKTWLMDLFFQSLPFKEKRRRHFHRFMYEVHAHLKKLRERQAPLEEVAAKIASDTRVICFDEFFVSDIADAMILGTLFESLFRRGVTLVATSNVPPKDLYKEGLQRARFLPAIQLLEENTKVLAVDGGVDYRLRQLTQAGTYLLTDAADTNHRLEALFEELADGDAYDDSSGAHSDAKAAGSEVAGAAAGIKAPAAITPSAARKASAAIKAAAAINTAAAIKAPGAIKVEGRSIPVVREGASVVWFEFEAICEGPRSQNDYIVLAREYQSVIVANVPRFTAQRDNAARRFIALVDELYDHNVNLIVSAAAPPIDLYHGERLKFEFQRTSSRLIEMQTEQYLAREHRA
jgi:cell division protein ZapE